MRRPFAICLTIAALAPLPAAAQTYDLPKGCTAFLTIQGQGCQVRHLWTCTSDTEGAFWFAAMGAEGVSVISQLSEGSTNLYTEFPLLNGVETLTVARDPVDFDTVIAEGSDVYDTDFVDETGTTHTATGVFALIDGTVEIDGRVLQQFESRFELSQSGDLETVTISQGYVDTALGIFIIGRSWNESDPTEIFDRTPVDFIGPGEDGFLSTVPLYGCEG